MEAATEMSNEHEFIKSAIENLKKELTKIILETKSKKTENFTIAVVVWLSLSILLSVFITNLYLHRTTIAVKPNAGNELISLIDKRINLLKPTHAGEEDSDIEIIKENEHLQKKNKVV